MQHQLLGLLTIWINREEAVLLACKLEVLHLLPHALETFCILLCSVFQQVASTNHHEDWV